MRMRSVLGMVCNPPFGKKWGASFFCKICSSRKNAMVMVIIPVLNPWYNELKAIFLLAKDLADDHTFKTAKAIGQFGIIARLDWRHFTEPLDKSYAVSTFVGCANFEGLANSGRDQHVKQLTMHALDLDLLTHKALRVRGLVFIPDSRYSIDDHRKCAAHRKRAIALEKEDDSTTPDYEAPEPFDPETKVVRLHSNVRLGTCLL